jgi:predicted AAA+ superfamily ATPase
MIRRIQKLNKNNSFFLFGARGTGKSTLLRELFPEKDTLWIDFLSDQDEDLYGRNPDNLSRVIAESRPQRVVIDEVQKAPKILDVVHKEIEKNKSIQFIMTGSSARKLKRGAANLLAGRAFSYALFPFTAKELGQNFDLNQALHFGTLPALTMFSTHTDKEEFLRSYVRTYIKEEVQLEQLVRNLDPFRDFLEVAALANGQIINYSKIARDIGTDDKTVKSYFSILEDTLLGFHLPAFHRSIRKQQREAPKFYLFDPGVTRALSKTLRVELLPKTYAFGRAFEHFILLECHRLNEYLRLDYGLHYLRTKSDVEIDLIIQRPGKPDLLVEIKSTDRITTDDTRTVERISADWDRQCEAQVWSLDPTPQKIGRTRCLFWLDGLGEYASLT